VGAPDIVYWKKRFAAVRGRIELSAPLVREFLRRQPAVPSTAGTRLGSLSPLRSERETLLAMVGVLAAAPRPRRRSLWENAGAKDEDRPAEWLGWEVRSIQLPDGQTLRVALRPGNPAVPGVVYIYGGGEAAFNPALDFGEATVVIIERRTEVEAQELILKAAADIRLVLPRLESQNVHFPQGFFLVGHSLGGHVAAELATASPTAFARKIRGVATINWAVPQPAFIGQMNAVIGWMNQSVRVFSLFTFWPFVPAQWAKFRETAIKNLDRLIVPLTAHAYQIVTGRTLVFDKHFAPLSQAAAESEALQHYLRDRFSQTWATFERENTLPILLIRNTNDPLTYGLAARVRDLHVSDEFSDQRPVRWAVNLMTGDHPAEWHSPHMDASQVALVADALRQFMKHATAPAGENVLDFPPAVARAPRVEFRQWGLLGSLGFAVGLAALSMVYLAGVTVVQASPALAALGTAGTALLGSGLWSALVRVRRLNRWGGVLGKSPPP
jgi:pimeloyl-ACP methyl ester carboxylesterase